MASPQQTQANTRNGHLAPGHKTAEGKAISAKNATKHGLTSKEAVLASEDQSDFDALLHQYRCLYTPGTPDQRFLVQQLAESEWRLRRARRLETQFFNEHSEDQILNDKEISAALARLNRYEGAIERSYYKALKAVKAEMKLTEANNRMMLDAYINGPLPTAKRSETHLDFEDESDDIAQPAATFTPNASAFEVT